MIDKVRKVKRLVSDWYNLSSKSLYYFCKTVLGYKDITVNTHKRLCNLLEDDSKKNKLILLPRGTFKTSIIAIAYPLWYILFRDHNARVMICSDTYNNAVKIIFMIKQIVETNEKLKMLFGDLRGKRWREDEIDLAVRTEYKKEPSISCGTQDVTRVGQHFDLIICDDIVTDVNTQTEEQMRKTVEYFKSLYSILEPDGKMIVNGTRWSFSRYELYQYILDNLFSEFDIYIEKAIRDDGSLFFPERFSKEKLAEIMRLQGSLMFSMQYLNTPISPDEQIFKRVSTFDRYDEIPTNLNIFITVDPAISMSDKADYTGIVVCGVDVTETIYVLDALRLKVLPDKLIDTLFYLNSKWQPKSIGIETVAFQKSLQYYLSIEEQRRGVSLGIVELKAEPTRSKFNRIISLQPYFERGQIKVYSKLFELLDELRLYPRGSHDDLVDALAYQLNIIYPPVKEGSIEFKDDWEDYLEKKKLGKAVRPPYWYRIRQKEEMYYD